MFGGADPAIPNLVADGITFRRNYLSRPMAWRDPIIRTPQGVTARARGRRIAAGRGLRLPRRRPAAGRARTPMGPVDRLRRSHA